MEQLLLTVLRDKAYDKKPNVDELKKIAGLEQVTGAQRDVAWKAYQDEQVKEASSETASTKTEQPLQPEQPTHRVTVKKDGFRRCDRAWSGSEDVILSDDEVSILDADPMFVVVEL